MLESLQESFAAMVILGLFTGAAFGFTLQRGRFCMNTAFRDILLTKDFTTFQAYILALLISIVGVNLLVDFGLIESEIKPFNWLANAIGGYLFGIGIVFAGGCGAARGTGSGRGWSAPWSRSSGSRSRRWRPASGSSTSSGSIFGRKTSRSRSTIRPDAPRLGRRQQVDRHRRHHGGPGDLAFPGPAARPSEGLDMAGDRRGHRSPYRLRLVELESRGEGGRITLASTTVSLLSYPTVGIPKPNWGMFMLIGIPLGAFVSARLLGEAKLRGPSEPSRYLKQFGGGLLMGFAAMQSGGCNINQGLTNLSMLSLGSLEVILFIILGNWTMVWFLFLRD